jgi:hypothetical protein
MICWSIVGAMETSLLGLQATMVMVMPLLALVETGKAAGQQFLSCDDLRTIREMPGAREHDCR